ncbi:MAG: hypothetical protein DSM106950_31745 [Stigonema ocellatum SAG 48.90 = DSM 106950]|nr:hypothetical protein [Stigonema ocellatum SAG 48.90 = DSM 106950]
MVVWVFAGGGHSEVQALIPFLRKHFPRCRFERKTPVRQKPGSKPNKAVSYGKTGQSLIDQISEELPIALKYEPNICDLILVFDDLDCRPPESQREKILEAISKIQESVDIEKFVGFASPELESWIIADWSHSIGQHPDFRSRHQRMRWWLSTERNVPFDSPESFSEYDRQKDCCQEKLSEALIDSSVLDEFDSSLPRFSKGLHTPLLLGEIQPNEVQKRCPLFRELYNYLNNFCQNS